MNKKYFVIGFVLLASVFVGFIFAGVKSGYFSSSQDNGTFTVSLVPATAFEGKIVSIRENEFTLLVGGNMALDPALKERVVRFDNNVPVIIEKEKKDPETYQEEVWSHMKAVQTVSSLPEKEADEKIAELSVPEAYVLESVSADSLTSGMRIIVYTNHDVMDEKEFGVTKIRILYAE